MRGVIRDLLVREEGSAEVVREWVQVVEGVWEGRRDSIAVGEVCCCGSLNQVREALA